MACEKTIWVGSFKDEKGQFEILVPACNRDEAFDKVKKSIVDIKKGKRGVTDPIGQEDMIFLEDVGNFDYIRV